MNKQVTITSTANHLGHTKNDEDETIYVTTKQAITFADHINEINANKNHSDSYYEQNNLDEDIYDFSSVKNQMNSNENNAINNYTDEDEEDGK